MSNAVIEIKSLGKTYKSGFLNRNKVYALKGLDLSIQAGEIFGFLGPNGAGKTTALHCMLGLQKPSQGSALLFGHVADKNPCVFQRIGYVPEEFNFYQYLTGVELMTFFGRIYNLPPVQIRSRTDEIFDKLALTDARSRKIKTYSKGMKQRLALAHALLSEPELLFLDEPTRGLDPVGVKLVRDSLLTLAEKGSTIFLNSHVLSEVEMVAHRVGILNAGRLIWEGNPRNLPGKASGHRVAFTLPAAATLPDFPDTVQPDGTRNVETKDDESLYRLVDAIRQAGGRIIEVSRKQRLEDHFLDLIQNSSEDPAEAHE